MTLHHHHEDAWRVRVDDDGGTPCGAGVLLDDTHVLTCAHVVRDAGAEPHGTASRVLVRSVACAPEWTRTARVAPGSWVHGNDTRRGDVALLELDEPAGCGTRTRLWKAPISGGRVRVYGFPQAEEFGIFTEAQLVGAGGRQGEWGQLNRVNTGDPWIEKGYSGAGVMAKGGPFDRHVIGIVVADYVDGEARAAWMLPTETILKYLPQLEEFTGGHRGNELEPSGDGLAEDVLDDPLRLALTQELTRLLAGGWSGTVVVSTDSSLRAGSSWLVRLVRTADPASRATVSDDELTGAPGDTVLGLGAIDAAYDACDKSVDEVRDYLVGRFGLPDGTPRLTADRLLRREPPACLVVGRIDRAADPDALVWELLRPLAAGSRSRGLRLVLGFEGRPPAGLPYDVSLDPAPLSGTASSSVTAQEVQEAVRRLAADEGAAARLYRQWDLKFFGVRRPPARVAPRLRVRLAVARTTEPNPELAAAHAEADKARAEVEAFRKTLQNTVDTYDDLCTSLELHRVRAARFFGEEDRRLADLYAPAARALQTVPIDLAAARRLVRRYIDEVNRRIDEG